MLLSLLGTWLTLPLILFEVAPQVCSHSISTLSSCETRSNIFYYLGKAAHTKWWAIIKRSNTPLAQLNIWLLNSSGKWNSVPGEEQGRGRDVGDLNRSSFLFCSTLQFAKPHTCIFSLNFHHCPLVWALWSLLPRGGAEAWRGQVTHPGPTWPNSGQLWSVK